MKDVLFGTWGMKTLTLTLAAIILAAFSGGAEIAWGWKVMPWIVFLICLSRELEQRGR